MTFEGMGTLGASLILRQAAAASLAASLFLAGCISPRQSAKRAAANLALPPTFNELAQSMLAQDLPLDQLFAKGPCAIDLKTDLVIKEGQASYAADIATPQLSGRAPLVILQHGNHSRKEAHREHITHLASHGFVALSLQMPNRDRWIQNGKALARLITQLTAKPGAISSRINRKRIVVAGHSFGGSAATIAAAAGAPIKGVVLLDPAVFSSRVEVAMQRANIPAILIGADRDVFRSRRRPSFARLWAGPFAEISIRSATHDDAQSPSMFALTTFGFDPYTSDGQRAVFRAALTASAFALSVEKSSDFAWRVFGELDRRGLLTEAVRRSGSGDDLPPLP